MKTIHLATVDSTNEEAKRQLGELEIGSWLSVTADEQRAGRGQYARKWWSPPGGIYLSVARVFEDHAKPVPSNLYSLAVGISVALRLREVAQVPVQVKPVNDLLLFDRKLGGILIETGVQGGKLSHIVAGVGVNVRRKGQQPPHGIPAPAFLDDGDVAVELNNESSGVLVEQIRLAVIYAIENVAARQFDWMKPGWKQVRTNDSELSYVSGLIQS